MSEEPVNTQQLTMLGADHIDEIKALITSGDVKLESYRSKYFGILGQQCPLDDEQLTRAIAATTDDDDTLFMNMCARIRDGE